MGNYFHHVGLAGRFWRQSVSRLTLVSTQLSSVRGKLVIMATRVPNINASLDDMVDALNRDAIKASSMKQVFRTVGTVLSLIQVSCLVLRPSVNSHRWPNQDRMIDNKDYLELSEYCFNVCEVLKTSIQGKSVDDLDESVREALQNLERCVD